MEKTGTIKQKVTINATPLEVYNAFTDARKHSAFTGAKATGAAKVGSKITAWDGYIMGKNLKLSKGKLIVQEWWTTEWPEGSAPSILSIKLEPKGKKTLLTMTQTKVPKSQIRSYTSGWYESYWDPLAKYFED